MTLLSNIDMDVDNYSIFLGNIADNFDNIRDCSLTPNQQQSRTASMTSSIHSVDYAGKCEQMNNFIKDENIKNPIDSSQLFYASLKKQRNQVSIVADSSSNIRQQCVPSNGLALSKKSNYSNNMFNMQLFYDINQALDPKSWDCNFHTISLHGSLEHLASDIKSIKESLKRMQKYILNKSIISDKVNDIRDLECISEAA